MKTLILLLPFLLALLFGCAEKPVDFTGKWKFYDMKQDDILLFTSNKSLRKKLILEQVKRDAKVMRKMGVSDADYIKIVTRRSEEMLGLTFDFQHKNKLTISLNPKEKTDDLTFSYLYSDSTKQLVVQSKPGATDRIFDVKFNQDTLILKEGVSLVRLVKYK